MTDGRSPFGAAEAQAAGGRGPCFVVENRVHSRCKPRVAVSDKAALSDTPKTSDSPAAGAWSVGGGPGGAELLRGWELRPLNAWP